jgi:hypothetical protein
MPMSKQLTLRKDRSTNLLWCINFSNRSVGESTMEASGGKNINTGSSAMKLPDEAIGCESFQRYVQ